MGTPAKHTNIPRSNYKTYEGNLTTNTTLAVATDLGRTAIDGSITNTHATNSFQFKLNASTNDAYTLEKDETFSLEGHQVTAIYLVHGSDSSYKVFVD
jgi:hypothetical protein